MHQNPQNRLVAPGTHRAAALAPWPQSEIATMRGITLVELIMVMAILAVLVALLTIPIKMVMETARSTKCQVNQGQLYTAFQSYAADWRGRLPPNNLFNPPPNHLLVPQVKYTNWINVLARQSGIVSGNYEKLLGGKPRLWVDMDWGGIRSGPFLCPEVRSQTNSSPTWYSGGYGVITTCSSHKGPLFSNGVGLLLVRISNPSSRVMLMDGDMGISQWHSRSPCDT
jgi:prepilin-type N-terminal cleavage/methylation domain-containing protein